MIDLPDGLSIDWPLVADEALHDDVHRVVAAVVALGGAVGWVEVPDRTETANWLDRELAKAAAERAAVAVVRRSGRLEALGMWTRYVPPVLARNAEVRKVMVHPDARGAGLARLLMVALIDSARAAGVEVLRLGVRGNNHAAQALYESLGWTECGRVPDFIGLGDDRWDEVSYYLDLPRPAGVRRHGSAAVGPGSSRRADGSAPPTKDAIVSLPT